MVPVDVLRPEASELIGPAERERLIENQAATNRHRHTAGGARPVAMSPSCSAQATLLSLPQSAEHDEVPSNRHWLGTKGHCSAREICAQPHSPAPEGSGLVSPSCARRLVRDRCTTSDTIPIPRSRPPRIAMPSVSAGLPPVAARGAAEPPRAGRGAGAAEGVAMGRSTGDVAIATFADPEAPTT